MLTIAAMDHVARIPEHEVCAAALEPVAPGATTRHDHPDVDTRMSRVGARMMIESVPRFLQGVFPFAGSGLASPTTLPTLSYTVPTSRRAQLIYFRGGNSSFELAVVSLLRGGVVMRVFPIGAKSGIHVPLAVVEDMEPDSVISVTVAAPEGAVGEVVVDIGLIEI